MGKKNKTSTTKKPSAMTPFRELELHLKLEDIEKKWEKAKNSYNEDGTAKDVEEVLRLTVEKIKILTELSTVSYEA
jgi:hypothetical protein